MMPAISLQISLLTLEKIPCLLFRGYYKHFDQSTERLCVFFSSFASKQILGNCAFVTLLIVSTELVIAVHRLLVV